MPPSPPSDQTSSTALSRYLHYGVLVLLVTGGLLYWAFKPAALNPMADPRAAEAMALVQTHRALGMPTLLQALNEHIRSLSERGRGVRAGEWTVKHLSGDRYLVTVAVREQEATQRWYEREYQWQADLATKSVRAVSTPAEGLMPVDESGRMPLVQPRYSR